METPGAYLSDATLIARVYLDDDREAFDLIDERYRSRIINYLYRIVGDFERARDLAQEVIIKVYAGIPQLTSFENIQGWIYQIARNSLGMEGRRHQAEGTLSLDSVLAIAEGGMALLGAFVGSDSHRPDCLASRRSLEKKVERAILRLPPRLREVVRLCIMQGLPYGKVAEILRVARKTVGTRLYRARRLMEEYLDSAPDD
jgi:RNA polymerase sigma-70 factor (ECF subfamily)